MADESPQSTSPAEGTPGSAPETILPDNTISFGEEPDRFGKEDRARKLVVACVVMGIIAAVVAVVSFVTRPKPRATGAIESAYAVALPGDNVLATIRVSFQNIGGKPLWIRDIKAQLTTVEGRQYTDVAASASDFERYFRSYPDLRVNSIQPLKIESKLLPGDQVRGSIIVEFPVTLDGFNNRRSLAAIVIPYAEFLAPAGSDEAPVTITQQGR